MWDICYTVDKLGSHTDNIILLWKRKKTQEIFEVM